MLGSETREGPDYREMTLPYFGLRTLPSAPRCYAVYLLGKRKPLSP